MICETKICSEPNAMKKKKNMNSENNECGVFGSVRNFIPPSITHIHQSLFLCCCFVPVYSRCDVAQLNGCPTMAFYIICYYHWPPFGRVPNMAHIIIWNELLVLFRRKLFIRFVFRRNINNKWQNSSVGFADVSLFVGAKWIRWMCNSDSHAICISLCVCFSSISCVFILFNAFSCLAIKYMYLP